MTLIEGVGDEVVQFMVAVVVILVGTLAWLSTNARPDRYRTVLVMRSRPHHPVTVSIRTRPSLMTSSTQVTSVNTTTATDPPAPSAAGTSAPEEPREPQVIPLQEMDSIVDADVAMLDNNRLHFYRRIDSPNPTQNTDSTSDESEPADDLDLSSNAQIEEMNRIVSAMEADVNTSRDWYSQEPNTASNAVSSPVKSEDNSVKPDAATPDVTGDPGEPSGEDTRKILIRLKYLNDTLKEVEGSLDELLKDFKTRHFSTELSSECRVRLIFNGRVLLDDAATLRACGLHDRAVVHCLVHPIRTANQPRATQEEGQNTTHELITEGHHPERAWDLENILMTLVSVALTVVWFFRCEYSNMFTASASVALFGLTVFYSVAIFGLYLSDTFHFDRRQAPVNAPPPMPN
ncbi:transmembrane and ubiquitin-like domain-containing protein 1 isoform X2 [Pectinophora gossypiella]|nr:transmembrane and ubiquitin-like domain-containing protein 1 isoform X2 [Pectinophora gossypiella]XP_049870758.1 transmembrane and ubiquitin-like domain-containing protein 1 isoform X2 [Pectinophora gossypiella]